MGKRRRKTTDWKRVLGCELYDQLRSCGSPSEARAVFQGAPIFERLTGEERRLCMRSMCEHVRVTQMDRNIPLSGGEYGNGTLASPVVGGTISGLPKGVECSSPDDVPNLDDHVVVQLAKHLRQENLRLTGRVEFLEGALAAVYDTLNEGGEAVAG